MDLLTYSIKPFDLSKMEFLPLDIVDHVSTFLQLSDTIVLLRTTKKWKLTRYRHRQKRRVFCLSRLSSRRIPNGNCVNSLCNRRKLTCILLEPLKSQNLANYCAPCFKKFYPNIDLYNFVAGS